MHKIFVIALLCVVPLFCDGTSVDQTVQPLASGEAVVDAAIEKIRSKCVLINDKFMMKRIAAVETDFGKQMAPLTGGIWKSASVLPLVKMYCSTIVRSVCNDILNLFFIDLSMVTLPQLEMPLYSALVMHVHLSNLNISIPSSKVQQATFWKQYINQNGNTNDYVSKSSMNISCSAVRMELIFAIDASGSVGSVNFQKTLSFLNSVVAKLQIAPDMTRVAVIRYGSYSTPAIDFSSSSSVTNLQNLISAIGYTGGGTATYRAIDMARTIFSDVNQTRQNVPKVFVLITDGYSNNERMTVEAALKLKQDKVTVFTIGIGRIRERELLAVASDPSCTHYFFLNNYNEIDAIINEIQRESCEAPLEMTSVKGNTATPPVDNPIPQDNSIKVQVISIVDNSNSSGSSSQNNSNSPDTQNIQVEVVCGIVVMYGSTDFDKPNEALHAYKAIAKDGKPGLIEYKGQKLYVTLIAKKRNDNPPGVACGYPHYNISLNVPTNTETEVLCRQNGIERNCTVEEISKVFGPVCNADNIPNPCTNENLQKNILRFKHPKSLYKYIQCKLTGAMEIVTCPAGKQYVESLATCGPSVTGLPPNSVPYTTGPNPCTVDAIKRRQFYFANPADKYTFIQCDEFGNAFLVNCPNNTAWSQIAYTCVHDFSALTPPVNPCQGNSVFYYENPNDMKSFIQCDAQGQAYIMPCQVGTVWSNTNKVCVHDPVSLISNGALPPALPTTTTTTATTSAPVGAQCSPGVSYIPHESDASKFYQCTSSGKVLFSCPAGLLWNNAKMYCDWPSNISG